GRPEVPRPGHGQRRRARHPWGGAPVARAATRRSDAATGLCVPFASIVTAVGAVDLDLLVGDLGLHGLVVRHGPLAETHVLRRDGLLLHARTLLGEGDVHLLVGEGATGAAVGGLALQDDLLALHGHLDPFGVG